jgi:hypothetical protein
MLIYLSLTLAPVAAESCPAEPAAALASLPYDQFDTASGETAWRTLIGRGCVDSAVATLKAYRSANAAHMSADQMRELTFHMGQALLMSDRDSDSIAYFEAAAGPGSTAEWSAYVQAHLGFARKDRALVEAAEAAYAKLVPPQSIRLRFIRGFLKCVDKPYMVAAHCTM